MRKCGLVRRPYCNPIFRVLSAFMLVGSRNRDKPVQKTALEPQRYRQRDKKADRQYTQKKQTDSKEMLMNDRINAP